MVDNKVLIVMLGSGRFIKQGRGKGREQYNINENAIINGNYYGVVLRAGDWNDLSLGLIDVDADKNTEVIDGVLLIYLERDEKKNTYIVAIAENTIVYRKMQLDKDIIDNRPHLNNENLEHVGYHTITSADDMHLLKDNQIPISIPIGSEYAFRSQRFLDKKNKYSDLKKQIVTKACSFLYDSELDLSYDQIYNAKEYSGIDSSTEMPDTFDTSQGTQIRKRPWVSKNALRAAGFLCEFNQDHKTFLTDKGQQFMEGHHLIRCTVELHNKFSERFNKSIDTESNIVSLCPTCHRRIHYGNKEERTAMIENLFDKRRKGLHDTGIHISLEELKYIYHL